MSVEPRENLIGLVTNASTLATPPGALIEAENVVIRKPGTVEPRDGLAPGTGMVGTEVWGFSYQARNLIARWTGSAFDWRTTAGETLTGYAQPLRRDVLTRAESRGILYLPGASGVYRLSGADIAFQDAGLPLQSAITATNAVGSTPGWMPTGHHVAYRVVGYNKTSDGLERRSIPSGAVERVNASGVTRNPVVTVSTTGTAYTEFELYRGTSAPIGTVLDEEMQLVGRFSVNLTLPGFAVIDDTITPDARGATLYTSPSRDGATGQNDRPPACACVATYKGSVFFGNIRGPKQITLNYNSSAALEGSATGIGMRSYVGDSVDGSGVMTGMASTVGLSIGMKVTNGTFTGAVMNVSDVTAVTAATVSFTPAFATGGGVGVTYRFHDTIEIGGLIKYVAPVPSNTIAVPNLLTLGSANGLQVYLVTPPTGGFNTTIVIQTTSRAATPQLTLRATHGPEYSPPLPLLTGTAINADQDVSPGVIMWSKTDEPEHVAPINYAFVGDQKKAILGLVPTRDALFILKEDGVWRLTGANAFWRIDPYDPTMYVCLPTSVVPLQEQAYFLSNKGVVAFSDSGSEIVSLPINDQIKPVIDRVFDNFRTTGLYELPPIVGSTAGVYERENEYTLLTARGGPAFVYNRNTGAWTTWQITMAASEAGLVQAIFHLSYPGRVVYSLTTGGGVTAAVWTWLSTDVPISAEALFLAPRFNRQLAATVSAVSGTGTTRTLTLLVAATVLADDVLQDGLSRLWRITTAATASTSIVVEALGAAVPTTGSAVLYRTLRCRVTPQVFSGPAPRPKHWRGLSTAFSSLIGPVAVRYAYASSESVRVTPGGWDQEDVDWPRPGIEPNVIQFEMGFSYTGLVPAAHARSWSLRASVRWVMSHGIAALEGFYVDSETMQIGRQQKT